MQDDMRSYMQILTTPFYRRDLEVYGFWHLKGGGPRTNPPVDTEDGFVTASVLGKGGLPGQSQVSNYFVY